MGSDSARNSGSIGPYVRRHFFSGLVMDISISKLEASSDGKAKFQHNGLSGEMLWDQLSLHDWLFFLRDKYSDCLFTFIWCRKNTSVH